MDISEHWKAAMAIIGAILGCFASIAVAVAGLAGLMFFDLLSAIVANGKRAKLDPQAGYLGWKRKCNTLIVVLAIALAQHLALLQGVSQVELPAAQVIAGGFALVEILSIIRNLKLAGGWLPRFLEGAFKQAEEAVGAGKPGG
jgi:phage-related holin